MIKTVIDRRYTIEVIRPKMLPPAVGSAEPRREYAVVFTTRANVKTMAGKSEFAQVEIKGQRVTHVFSIRYTTLQFDVRDLVRSADGSLYKILSIDDVELHNRELKISCVSQGDETVEGAR